MSDLTFLNAARQLISTALFSAVITASAMAQNEPVRKAEQFSTPPPSALRSPTAAGPPQNLQAGSFTWLVEQMWAASATFRRQCQRLAAERGLMVTLRADPSRPDVFIRASTTILRRDRRMSARILVTSTVNAVELIAHEVEHVIEQLDGIDLSEHVSSGNSKRHGNAYESLRAVAVGRQVAREVHGDCRGRACERGNAR